MTGLGDLPGNEFDSEASAVSADGSVVVGWGLPGPREAFRWEGGGIGFTRDENRGASNWQIHRGDGSNPNNPWLFLFLWDGFIIWISLFDRYCVFVSKCPQVTEFQSISACWNCEFSFSPNGEFSGQVAQCWFIISTV